MSGAPAGASDRERGSGTVLVLGVIAVVLALLVATGSLVAAQRGRAGAQSAADLAALAAAARLTDPTGAGPGGACAVAREVASRNGARLTSCRADTDGSVVVTTARRSGTAGTATARARAGPADLRPGGAARGP